MTAMAAKPEGTGTEEYWFVGADQTNTSRFLRDGIWQDGDSNKNRSLIKSIPVGAPIAMKANYTQKNNLPFGNYGYRVCVMDIKATGTVTGNCGDGRTVDVEWTPFDPPRKWYFYTYRGNTVWRVSLNGGWYNAALIAFTFHNEQQDYDRFRNDPYWRNRFGDTSFYEAVADKLLLYRNRRSELLEGIYSIAAKRKDLSYLQDKFPDGSVGPLKDICPFTVMGIFNYYVTDVSYKITNANRKSIAAELAAFLGVEETMPDSLEGIPTLNNELSHTSHRASMFFGFAGKRKPDDIDALWEIFDRAIAFSDSGDAKARAAFVSAYDNATERLGVGWNLTMGLFWIRPWNFPTLDSRSRDYISEKLNIKIGLNGPQGYAGANDYLTVLETLETRFLEEASPVHSFPDLSLAACRFKGDETSAKLSALEKDIRTFQSVCTDFTSFSNPGKMYADREHFYTDTAIKNAAEWFAALDDDGSNATDIYLQIMEPANFHNWRETVKKLRSNPDFQSDVALWFKAVTEDNIDEDIFNKTKESMVNIGIPANIFLMTILFPAFLHNPDKYFACKSALLIRAMKRYGFSIVKQGAYLSYKQFWEIQKFGAFLYESLSPFEPKDMVDIQSFLWIVDNKIKEPNRNGPSAGNDSKTEEEPGEEMMIAPIEPYSVDNIISDGCFIEQEKLEKMLRRLQTKKNLILQGPPGTGKTWLAKRLAFALIGQKNGSKVRAVQFHPNLSYEDFVRGWRPSGDGKITLTDGPFVEMIRAAKSEPSTKHVIVIEEINRGNPAQILGEMLTLLEPDKRTPAEALELSYGGERVFIPGNLYVIGTMNIADRSLALVDLALRRRFAFIDLKPTLGKAWKEWVQTQAGISTEILNEIESRILSLNAEITSDSGLGEQFSIGHSYVTPPAGMHIDDAREWFREVVDTEIGPLLDEYWFDSPGKAGKAKEQLLKGF
ncbi:AAA family ATPase [Candidatus Haliotispira prima]|uniref:AAA family ATPase n=1 Tax=Candidatus Haliotispira prima TaxID=3034016 RepID=A0ABY8MK13_9SPIO|nr:AAA family ATPase [Candidatus Haliotispira prima]